MAKSEFKINKSGVGSFTVLSTSALNLNMIEVAREIKAEASILAVRKSARSKHARTFRLSRSFGSRAHSRTERRTRYRVSNTAPYAVYVFQGTTGPITSKSGGLMPVGRSQIGNRRLGRKRSFRQAGVSLKRSVKGQMADNLPMEAATTVMRRRGFNPRITALKL